MNRAHSFLWAAEFRGEQHFFEPPPQYIRAESLESQNFSGCIFKLLVMIIYPCSSCKV